MRSPFRGVGGGGPTSAALPVGGAGLEGGRAGGDAEWPKQVKSSGIRVQPLTAFLGVALVAIVGFWGGAELQKRQGTGAAAASSGFPTGAFASRSAGGTGRGAFTGLPSAAANVTAGTVTVVSGNTLYLTSSTGAIVKVKLSAGTKYTRTAKASKTSLKPGDTAIVHGAKKAAGATVATSVAATAKGVAVAETVFPGGFGTRSAGNTVSGANGG